MRSLGYRLPQAQRSIRTGREVMIERDDRGDGRRSRGPADEYDGEPMFGFPKDEVLAVACAAPENWPERADAARLAE